jgi:hypothetical protein
MKKIKLLPSTQEYKNVFQKTWKIKPSYFQIQSDLTEMWNYFYNINNNSITTQV